MPVFVKDFEAIGAKAAVVSPHGTIGEIVRRAAAAAALVIDRVVPPDRDLFLKQSPK